MIHYTCDWCGKTKKEGATWILGHAPEMVGHKSLCRPRRTQLAVVSASAASAG